MKCLIVDELHDSIHDLIQEIGIEYSYQPDITRAEIKEQLSTYDGLIIRSKTRVDQDLLEKAHKLKFIARAGAGLDNLDQEFLQSRGIEIINAPEGNRDAVGEHVLGMILSLLHNLHKSHLEIINGIWAREDNRGEELNTKTVGIIGYGNMGKATARRLKPMGCRVLAYDKYLSNYGDEYADEASLEEIMSEADILSLHIPLTPETRDMVNKEFIGGFKKNIIFVNSSRGEIVPLKDIAQLVQSGKIRKAALDVLQNEKLASYTHEEEKNMEILKQSGRVIFSPHVAGWSFESYELINRVMIEKLSDFLEKVN